MTIHALVRGSTLLGLGELRSKGLNCLKLGEKFFTGEEFGDGGIGSTITDTDTDDDVEDESAESVGADFTYDPIIVVCQIKPFLVFENNYGYKE